MSPALAQVRTYPAPGFARRAALPVADITAIATTTTTTTTGRGWVSVRE